MACHAVLPATEPMGVCPTCWPTLPFWRTELVPPPRLADNIDAFYAPFLYEDPVKHWIKALKFHDRTELAAVLADFMVNTLPARASSGVAPLVVPVPLHRRRLRQRLFNQSALLARFIAQKNQAVYAPLVLSRVKYTTPQTRKTKRQRLQLTVNVFQVQQNVLGRHIILIDDILTTGTTAAACAKALKRAGASRVDVLTAAYVAP